MNIVLYIQGESVFCGDDERVSVLELKKSVALLSSGGSVFSERIFIYDFHLHVIE